MIQELFLEPGDLAALFRARGMELEPESELLTSGMMATLSQHEPLQLDGLDSALATLAGPSRVIAGRRAARRMEAWPFSLYRREKGPVVLLAQEGCGYGRLRFPYSEPDLMDWLAGPFRRFARPQIGCAELPALAPAGLAVLLSIVDFFRHRFPDLDPDWAETEPVVFGLPELVARVRSASSSGTDPSCLWKGLAGLGMAPSPELSSDQVESLLYVFANEGYLTVDTTYPEPLFGLTEAFLGVPLSLAWWDLSLSLQVTLGEPRGHQRVIQGLALWSFQTLEDGRVTMKATSGAELEAEMRSLIFGEPLCPNCGHVLHAHATFCGGCGTRVHGDRCSRCHHFLEAGAHFCPECGARR